MHAKYRPRRFSDLGGRGSKESPRGNLAARRRAGALPRRQGKQQAARGANEGVVSCGKPPARRRR